jgi:hypothetical protein
MKEVTEEIKALQARLEEGDVITIWKDEFQIKLTGNMPTNYELED